MAIAGLVCGIVALVFAFIPVFGWLISAPLVAIGLPLAGVAFGLNLKRKEKFALAVSGVAVNMVAIGINALWLMLFAAAIAGMLSE